MRAVREATRKSSADFCGKSTFLGLPVPLGAARAGLLSSVSLAAMLACGPAQAQTTSCPQPSSSHDSCTLASGTYTQSLTLSGEGDNGDGDDNGKSGPDYTLNSYGTFNIGGNQAWGIVLQSQGGDGSDDGHSDGGNGGDLILNNYGAISLTGTSNDTLYGIYLRSEGGKGGGDSDDTSAGSDDGGRGGDGGHLVLTNRGSITINQSIHDGAVGVFVESRAGQGGDQDSGIGDQQGGNSGDAKNILISNAGAISIGTSSNYVRGADYAWGIAALGRGNEGGDDNGKGGTGSAIEIRNTGAIGIYWNGVDSTSSGLRGIYGLSEGGDGTDSHDDSDKGGDGEAGYQVLISNSASINITSQTTVSGLSAGILAISQGSDGGEAPGSNKGGDGGNGGDTSGGRDGTTRVVLNGSGRIDTSGDGISGIIVRSRGGAGGDGQDGEHDSSGGDGGNGGAVIISLQDSATIDTDGVESFGVVAQSIGGRGGDGGDDTALVGQSGGGGYGGNGDTVAFSSASGALVTTHGDGAAGLVLQSIGGGGGTAGDFVSLIGASGDSGRGGDAGNVTVTASGNILTYGDTAAGIIAQSVAGTGGTGDMPDVGIFSLGGSGGDGGDAGEVSVTTYGIVLTQGYASRGIVAQSISGGGGSAGSLGEGFIAIGGSGGGGGSAGQVTVEHHGAVQTSGDAATGILAQSIGSGGGAGAGPLGIVLTVGGTGGDGGDGGKVAVVLENGTVATGGDYANAITAQSIGGGGGDGGDAFNYSTLIPNLGVGGSGGAAGNGDQVFVGNVRQSDGAVLGTAGISTYGDNAVGILAQSIGGGGGSGGSAVGAGVLDFINLQIGGSAADGTQGKRVQVDFDGLTLTTVGSNATGILAQSIGGGGGAGGAAYGANVDLLFSYALGIGGNGGAGSQGGDVIVELTDSTINTGQPSDTSIEVSDAVAIVAQSIGGGGGNGGRAMTAAVSQAIPVAAPVAITSTESIGGDGGASGHGGNVSVTLDGDTEVYTGGDGSHVVLAQSIGGGGGNGGAAWSYAITSGLGGGVFAFDLSTDVGGKGNSGGNAGQVTVNLADEAIISTTGNDADGILAQSIGGGGGNGGTGKAKASGSFGFTAITAKAAIGGFGGQGGDGGAVNVTTDAHTVISTLGGTSYGILAQSIGGGGGTSQGVAFGASEKAGITGTPLTLTLSQSVAIGLSGGAGGDGDQVTVTTNGLIVTQGAGANGVTAQSIGGGGGVGGSVAANAVAAGAILSTLYQVYEFNMGIGGSGGGGGDGGRVDLTHAGDIETLGDHAIGILSQSIGGGGGLGGTSTVAGQRTTGALNLVLGGDGGGGGKGGYVTLDFDDNNDDEVQTSGYMAHGVVLQSIGGGGGIGADASENTRATITIGANAGGDGGDANGGGQVSVSGWGNISTGGEDAIGLIAQSVGGGGGIAGTGATSGSRRIGAKSTGLSVGGDGGAGGNGGDVDINAGFNLNTSGDGALGILAQSVGGGGGYGGGGTTEVWAALVIGGQGGVAGDGGDVSVTLTSGTYIGTQGAGAHGVVAQSVGGGGGIGGDASGASFAYGQIGGGGGNSGDGGSVLVKADADIYVFGANAFGIFAQSIGNGGGFGGDGTTAFAGSTGTSGSGDGGAVTVFQLGGTISASGNGGVGIFAQSEGDESQGEVALTVNGSVAGGTGDQGTGILVAGGRNNTLEIGTTGSVSAASGVAIRYVGDRSTAFGSTLDITNYGSISGDVILDNADGVLSDSFAMSVALFAAPVPSASAGLLENYGTISQANLIQADLMNAGTLILGGRDAAHTTRVTGSFTQAAGGIIAAHADFAAGKVDLLSVGGDAVLDGHLRILPTTLLPYRSLSFLEVDGVATGTLTGLRANVFDFAVGQQGGSYSVSASADFDDAGFALNGPQARAAAYLQGLWDAGGGPLGSVFASLAMLDRGGYGGILSTLADGTVNAPAAETIALGQQHLDRLMSCPAFESDNAFVTQTDCLWAVAGGQVFDQSSFGAAAGYDDTIYSYAMGIQREIAPNWFLGFAGGYDDSRISGDGNDVSIDGSTGWAGATLKYELGSWLLAAAATGSYGSYDGDRNILLGPDGGVARGDNDGGSFAGRLRAAYTFAWDSFYLRPYLDLDLIYTNLSGYTEAGAGLLDRQVSGSDGWTGLATPAVEIGTRVNLDDGMILRGYARFGVTFSTTDSWSSTTTLALAPAFVDGLSVELPIDDIYGRVGAGLDLMNLKNNMNLRAEYEGAFSEHSTRNMGSLRFSLNF